MVEVYDAFDVVMFTDTYETHTVLASTELEALLSAARDLPGEIVSCTEVGSVILETEFADTVRSMVASEVYFQRWG